MISPNEPSRTEELLAPPPARARGVLIAGAVLAAGALAMVYLSPDLTGWPRLATGAAAFMLVGLFALDRFVLWARGDRRAFFAEYGMDVAILLAAGTLEALGLAFGGRFLPAAGLYLLLSRSWRLVPRRVLPAVMTTVLAATGLLAVTALTLEYGFRDPLPVPRNVLHAVQTVVMAVFILDRIVRLESARAKAAFLRENWVDFLLMTAAAAAVSIGPDVLGQVLSAGALYLIITQVYILVALVLRGVGVNMDFAGSGIDPGWLLIGSFAVLCLAGSGLLMMPAATPQGMQPPLYYDQALFTATSATCVTGLIVRDTGTEFTLFGQAVILGLIQLGGLGIMLFGTVLALLVGKGLSVRSSEALGQMIGTQGIGRLTRVAKFVVLTTFGAEIVGAVLMYPMFAAPRGSYTPTAAQAVWYSAFHSISAFCNAGFSLFNDNLMAGVSGGWGTPLRDRWQVLGVIAPLIVLGGLGFPVLQDCFKFARDTAVRVWRRRHVNIGRPLADTPRPRLSLHSKLVLASSALLIALGAAGLMLLAHEPAPPPLARNENIGAARQFKHDATRWKNLSTAAQIREAVFHSISARTAGFNTIDMSRDLTDGARLWVCGLMLVGGSPASTAGGMKTTTFAVLLLVAWSVLKRRDHVEAFHRGIPAMVLRRAMTLALLYLGLIAAVTVLLCVAMPRWDFMSLLFEACSACGTVGLSTGITPKLSLMGKFVVTAGMFAGRIGPLTLLLALTTHLRNVRYSYPSEDVVIG